MSLINKADVKNHLSSRHRTEIHLYRPEEQPEMAGVAEEGSGADAEIGDPTKAHLNPADSSGPGVVPAEVASVPAAVVFLAQSKSVKP